MAVCSLVANVYYGRLANGYPPLYRPAIFCYLCAPHIALNCAMSLTIRAYRTQQKIEQIAIHMRENIVAAL